MHEGRFPAENGNLLEDRNMAGGGKQRPANGKQCPESQAGRVILGLAQAGHPGYIHTTELKNLAQRIAPGEGNARERQPHRAEARDPEWSRLKDRHGEGGTTGLGRPGRRSVYRHDHTPRGKAKSQFPRRRLPPGGPPRRTAKN